MKTLYSLGITAMLLASVSAHADQFRNGKSYYGSPAPAGDYRTIDLSRGEPINLTCGETVNFASQGKVFAWRVSSIQHAGIPVARFAPAGFDAQGRTIYIAPGEHEQGG